MANVLTTLQTLIEESLELDDPTLPLPSDLSTAADTLQSLFSLQLEASGDGLEKWLATFRSLLQDVSLRETLLIRVLQVKLPRVAEGLALVGAITMAWDGAKSRPKSFGIAWNALEGFTKDPGEQALTLLASRVQGVPDAKALQVLLLLLATSPEELLRREYAQGGFLALPQGAGVTLQELVDLVNSPVHIWLSKDLLTQDDPIAWIRDHKAEALAGDHLTLEGPDEATFDPSKPLSGLGMELVADATRLRSLALDLGTTGWRLTADASASGGVTGKVRIVGDEVDVSAAGRGSATVRLLLKKGHQDGTDAFLFGQATGTHIAVRDIGVGATFFADGSGPVLGYSLRFEGLRYAVGLDLLKPIAMGLDLPGALKFDSALDLTWLQGVGLQAAGDGLVLGIDVPKHLGFVIGGTGAGLWIDDVLTRLEAGLSVSQRRVNFRVIFRFDARAELGPLRATVSGAGVWLGRWTTGNAGVVEPTGVGLSLDAGPVKGGGFIAKLGPGEYGGALSLKILGIGAFAYGIYKELPGGGISFVALIGIRLPVPGIQIGFGFAVSGFGGLVGINRRADTDKLRERLASGTAGDVLFTSDPTKNAPKLLGEMRELFPDERGVHVFGPTLQLNWVNIITLDIGLFIELPGPRKIFIAGTGRLIVGSEDLPLVNFRLDFIGGIDLTTSLIFFDGILVDSSLLGIIKVTGGVALRVGFGVNPWFLYSVGGFHPAFVAGGAVVPKVPRVGASLTFGPVWFRQETYFAVTSNTVQFGAKTEAGVEIGPISVHGWFAFDALVQFKPFHFVATIDAGMAASFEGYEFASIRVRGELSGPGPLVLRASASVKVILRISKSLTITLDKSPAEQVPPIPNLAEHLKDEITKPVNLRVDGDDPAVVLRVVGDGKDAVNPIGVLVWEQKRVPLDRLLHKAEARPLDPPRRLAVSVHDSGGAAVAVTSEEDLFSLGTFTHVSDAEALANPSFSPGRSGFRLAVGGTLAQSASSAPLDEVVDVVRLPQRSRLNSWLGARFAAGLLECLTEPSESGPRIREQAAKVMVHTELWVLPGGGAQHSADAFLAARESGSVALPLSTPSVSLAGVF